MREPLSTREPRYPVDLRAEDARSSFFTAGRVTNISRGGLFVETPRPLPIAAPLDLAVHLTETGAVLKIKGQVVWTYDIGKTRSRLAAGSGVRFVEMTGDQFALLESYLARLVTASSLLDATA